MRKNIKKMLSIMFVLMLLTVFVGCGGSGGSGTTTDTTTTTTTTDVDHPVAVEEEPVLCTLEGTIRDSSGNGVAGVAVNLYENGQIITGEDASKTAPKYSTKTDNEGFYRIAEVPEGDYYLAVKQDDIVIVEPQSVKIAAIEITPAAPVTNTNQGGSATPAEVVKISTIIQNIKVANAPFWQDITKVPSIASVTPSTCERGKHLFIAFADAEYKGAASVVRVKYNQFAGYVGDRGFSKGIIKKIKIINHKNELYAGIVYSGQAQETLSLLTKTATTTEKTATTANFAVMKFTDNKWVSVGNIADFNVKVKDIDLYSNDGKLFVGVVMAKNDATSGGDTGTIDYKGLIAKYEALKAYTEKMVVNQKEQISAIQDKMLYYEKQYNSGLITIEEFKKIKEQLEISLVQAKKGYDMCENTFATLKEIYNEICNNTKPDDLTKIKDLYTKLTEVENYLNTALGVSGSTTTTTPTITPEIEKQLKEYYEYVIKKYGTPAGYDAGNYKTILDMLNGLITASSKSLQIQYNDHKAKLEEVYKTEANYKPEDFKMVVAEIQAKLASLNEGISELANLQTKVDNLVGASTDNTINSTEVKYDIAVAELVNDKEFNVLRKPNFQENINVAEVSLFSNGGTILAAAVYKDSNFEKEAMAYYEKLEAEYKAIYEQKKQEIDKQVAEIQAKCDYKVNSIYADASKTVDGIWYNANLKIEELLKAGNAALYAHLTPEQRVKYETINKELLTKINELQQAKINKENDIRKTMQAEIDKISAPYIATEEQLKKMAEIKMSYQKKADELSANVNIKLNDLQAMYEQAKAKGDQATCDKIMAQIAEVKASYEKELSNIWAAYEKECSAIVPPMPEEVKKKIEELKANTESKVKEMIAMIDKEIADLNGKLLQLKKDFGIADQIPAKYLEEIEKIKKETDATCTKIKMEAEAKANEVKKAYQTKINELLASLKYEELKLVLMYQADSFDLNWSEYDKEHRLATNTVGLLSSYTIGNRALVSVNDIVLKRGQTPYIEGAVKVFDGKTWVDYVRIPKLGILGLSEFKGNAIMALWEVDPNVFNKDEKEEATVAKIEETSKMATTATKTAIAPVASKSAATVALTGNSYIGRIVEQNKFEYIGEPITKGVYNLTFKSIDNMIYVIYNENGVTYIKQAEIK